MLVSYNTVSLSLLQVEVAAEYPHAGFRLACCIAALMMIFVQLRKRHLPQKDDQAASSVMPIDR